MEMLTKNCAFNKTATFRTQLKFPRGSIVALIWFNLGSFPIRSMTLKIPQKYLKSVNWLNGESKKQI